MHGVRGADYACYRQARSANLQGTFRAFLSSYVQNLDSIVKYSDRNLPVVNTKGDLLFNSWAEVFQNSGKFKSRPPKIFSFGGKSVLQDFHWYFFYSSKTTNIQYSIFRRFKLVQKHLLIFRSFYV